jgi:hypothetical protein
MTQNWIRPVMSTSIEGGASAGGGLSATGVLSGTLTLRLSGRFAVVATGIVD